MNVVQALENPANKAKLSELLPDHVDEKRFVNVLISSVKKTPKLMQCDPTSVLTSCATAAQLGLEIGVLNQAWLIPYGRDCQLQIGYGGLITLAKQGDVAAVTTEVVCQSDYFKRTSDTIEHEWDPFDDHRGDVVGVYCILTLKNGEKQYETMSVKEINAIRDRSKAGRSGPWVTDYNEMARKTVLKRAMKKVKLSLAAMQAIEHDNKQTGYVDSTVVQSELGNKAVLSMLKGPVDSADVGDGDAGGDGADLLDGSGDHGGGADRNVAKKRAKKRGERAVPSGAGGSAKTADELEFDGNAREFDEPPYEDDDNPF